MAVEQLLLGKGNEDTTSGSDAVNQSLPLMPAKHDVTAKLANRSGRSPLLARAERETVLRLLVEKNVDVRSANDEAQAPILQTTRNDSGVAVQLQLSCRGCDSGSADMREMTPLLWATAQGYLPLVRSLLDKDTDPDAKDEWGWTLLSLAAAGGHQDVVRFLLLERNAEVDPVDSQGRTPLSWAAANGHEDVVRLLLDNGADEELEDKAGWTPLMRAAANEHEAVGWILLDQSPQAKLAEIIQPMLESFAAKQLVTKNAEETERRSFPDSPSVASSAVGEDDRIRNTGAVLRVISVYKDLRSLVFSPGRPNSGIDP